MVTQPSKRASRLSTASIQASVLASVLGLASVVVAVMSTIVPDTSSFH